MGAVIIFVMTVVPVYARKKQVKSEKTAPSDTLAENDRRRFEYFYLGAINEQTLGHLSAAYDLLNKCIEINPNAAEAFFSRGLFQITLKQDSLALHDYTRACELSPENNTYRERLAQFYIKEGKYDDAIQAYEQLYKHNYNRDEVLDILVQLYEQEKNYPMMLRTLERMETEEGGSEQITLQKMQVYDRQGDKKAAYNELHTLVQKHPYDTNYKVMMGNWLLNNERGKEALQMFNNVIKEDKDNVLAQLSLLDYYKMQQQDSLYRRQMSTVLLNPNTPDDAKATVIRQFIGENEEAGGDSTEVLNMFHKMLAQKQTSATTLQLLAAYMKLKQMPQDSITPVWRKILSIAPDDAATRLQLIMEEWKDNDYPEMIEQGKAAIQYNPDEMGFYYLLGAAYYHEDKEDEALDVFNKGIAYIKKDSSPELVTDLYAIMGDILFSKGEKEQAYKAYDNSLKWKSDNYGCLNNYAYYISKDGENLEKAEKMSFKTIQAEPHNTTYLDTYAWILFMEKRYEEAKIYIEQAMKNEKKEEESAVIAEHAADIYSMTGDTTKAIELWKKALNMKDCSNKALIEKKLKLKKYIAK